MIKTTTFVKHELESELKNKIVDAIKNDKFVIKDIITDYIPINSYYTHCTKTATIELPPVDRCEIKLIITERG